MILPFQKSKASENDFNPLTKEEYAVIVEKATEPPFSGKYVFNEQKGTYLCRRCNTPLYLSKHKFISECGWPSFDDEISGRIKRIPDSDGKRTEIVCAFCNAHLGHVFEGEKLTHKNIRHCVNSISLDFIPVEITNRLERAIFAGGCFWGVEYHFQKAKGVVWTRVGYTGGKTEFPTYAQVCSGKTGHAEAVEVFFDPQKTTYKELAILFFEIHDPSQINRQGPDIGSQYRSVIFTLNDRQASIAKELIQILMDKGYKIATKIEPASIFWVAEDYHQRYYQKKGNNALPYCHTYQKKFSSK